MQALQAFLQDLNALAVAKEMRDLSLSAEGHLQVGQSGTALSTEELEIRVRDCFLAAIQYFEKQGETSTLELFSSWRLGTTVLKQTIESFSKLDEQVKLIGQVMRQEFGKKLFDGTVKSFPFLSPDMRLTNDVQYR